LFSDSCPRPQKDIGANKGDFYAIGEILPLLDRKVRAKTWHHTRVPGKNTGTTPHQTVLAVNYVSHINQSIVSIFDINGSGIQAQSDAGPLAIETTVINDSCNNTLGRIA
jgi:hypothetical protein